MFMEHNADVSYTDKVSVIDYSAYYTYNSWSVALSRSARSKLHIIPRACARGKAISLSVVVVIVQKTEIFQDLQVQMSCERYKTVKIGDKMTDLCLFLLLTIHECDKL